MNQLIKSENFEIIFDFVMELLYIRGSRMAFQLGRLIYARQEILFEGLFSEFGDEPEMLFDVHLVRINYPILRLE